MEWINNPWVVGVGGGLLSGLLVTLITRSLLSRGSRKEYKRKLGQANREIISSLKSSVSEGTVPTREVVKSLINATIRKHNVDSQDAYGVIEVAEELSKEVMDSSFLSARDKSDFCDDILHLKRTTLDAQEEKESNFQKDIDSDFSSKFIHRLSLLTGTFVATLSLAMTVIRSREGFETNLPELFVPITGVLLATLVFTFGYYVLFIRRRHEYSEIVEEMKENNKDEIKDIREPGHTNGSEEKLETEAE